MSHDPFNDGCPCNKVSTEGMHICFIETCEKHCTCQPAAADDVPYIREWLEQCFNYGNLVESDRTEANEHFQTLLRIIDQQRSIMPEVRALIEIIDAMAEGNASAYSVIVRQKSLKAALKEIGE